jgi:hypothetical protein
LLVAAVTVAVSVTLAPAAMLVALDFTTVAVVACVIVTDSGFVVDVLGP